MDPLLRTHCETSRQIKGSSLEEPGFPGRGSHIIRRRQQGHQRVHWTLKVHGEIPIGSCDQNQHCPFLLIMTLPPHNCFSGQVYMKIYNSTGANYKTHICSNRCNPWRTQFLSHLDLQLYSIAEFQDSKRYQTYRHSMKLFLKEGLMSPKVALNSWSSCL